MTTARDDLVFFISHSDKMIRDIFTSMPCHNYFTAILELGSNVTPNKIHRKLLTLSYFQISGLIAKVAECTCRPEEHYCGYTESTCAKSRMIHLFQDYQQWNMRNSSWHETTGCTV